MVCCGIFPCRYILCLLLPVAFVPSGALRMVAQPLPLFSPDGKIALHFQSGNYWHVKVFSGDKWLADIPGPTLKIEGKEYPHYADGYLTEERRNVKDTIFPPIRIKRNKIPDCYNEVVFHFRGISVQYRAYHDGIAWRFLTLFDDIITIENENTGFHFPGDAVLYYPKMSPRPDADIFHTSFEEPYRIASFDTLRPDEMMFSPILVRLDPTLRIVLTESDLDDYPGMFLQPYGNGLRGVFAPYPLEETLKEGEFPQYIVSKRTDFIARTKGKRSFPWRVLAIGEDKVLPSTDIVYRLSSPNRLGDVSWVRPGRGTDEWIINIALYNVPFKAGINTATYKYYIDFAKRFGLQRIMLDAGWSDVKDLFNINPQLDMNEIAAYARHKGVRLCLWTLAATLERQLEPALSQFQRWGVDLIMTDFMDRDDQKMVNFYKKIAETCAKYQIMVMFHGAFKPAGLERTYPNVVTVEGVLGSEYNAWSEKATPLNNLLNAFIRMVAGPLDYEPGLLDNATQFTFRPIWGKVMSQGTRCHQLALFFVYDSPVQIFCGNPSTAWQEPEFMEFLGNLPTTWDETIVLHADLEKYILMARQRGELWYIGGIANWNGADLTIPLDFLPPGPYDAQICQDGWNADKYAADYQFIHRKVSDQDSLYIKMAPGGGFLARLKPATLQDVPTKRQQNIKKNHKR